MSGPTTSGRLAGRACLVTGSTGMAAAAATRFVAEGAAVFVVSRTEAHCRSLVAALEAEGAGGRAGYAVADLRDEDQVDRTMAAAVERFGRIDGLFSVAGGSGRRFGDGPIHELTAEGWDRTHELNLRTQALVARAVVRQMLAQPARDEVERRLHGSGGRRVTVGVDVVAAAAWAETVAEDLAQRVRSHPDLRLCLPTGDTRHRYPGDRRCTGRCGARRHTALSFR